MAYRIVFALLKLLSRMPFWCLHRISDLLYLVLYYVIGYRRKVILNNLAIAFPANSIKENKKIARKFIRHFADFLMESFKALTMTKDELRIRYVVKNPEVIQEEVRAGRSIILLAGHFGNWEWLVHNDLFSGVMGWAAYSPLRNQIFDKLMVANRERNGFKVVPSKKAALMLAKLNKNGTQFINLLVADQSPRGYYKHRTKFLGKDVPFFIGAEAYAIKYDLPVFYGRIKKGARSKYTLEAIPITISPQVAKKGWITEEYIRLMEADIREAPEIYLWSHRRFKHAAKAHT